MTPEEKQTLLQFMGVTYGQALKTDRDIVAHAGNLRPVSEQLKQQFEQVMATPTQEAPPILQQQSIPIPTAQPVDFSYPSPLPPSVVMPVITSEDNIKLIDVLTNIQVALENIATILDKNTIPNVKTTKTKTKE